MRIRKSWCTLCRENFEEGDDCMQCKQCKKKFHRECLQAENLIDNSQLKDIKNYLCYQCMNEENDMPENEERCKICREKSPNLVLLLCDGCPNSYHATCLGLQAESITEKWFCPVCKPEEHKNLDVRRMRKGFVIDNMNGEHVNSSTCYVCQRHGKLLGCDFCPNSFHPTCLPDLDFDNISDQWECPCCKNEDPLLNQGHKRWTKNEIQEIMKKRQKELSFWRSKIIKYRNRFLLAHRKDLQPFVNPRVFANLTKIFKNDFYNLKNNNGNKKLSKNNNDYDKTNIKKDLDIDSQEFDEYISSLEDEANENANKFIKSVFLSVYYPNGRKIERRPLVDNVQLKPHQEDGVEWLLKSFLTGGAILADEMGLGKTIQTLCFLSYLKCNKIDGPHLIVVPLSTVGNWLREIHRFTPHLTCIKICGSKNERTHAKEDRLAEKGLYDLYVTTYETVKNEEEFFVETIPKWQCIVLDEAHRIKNQSGAIRHSMDRVVGNMRLLLTGTPLQNNSAELFTLINFMFPDIFKNSEIIEQAFMNASQSSNSHKNNNLKNKNNKDEKNNQNINSGNSSKLNVDIGNIDLKSAIKEEDLKSIRCLLDKIMLRRLKDQAITLPRKIFHDVWLPLGSLSAHWYKRLLDIRSMVEEKVSVKKLLGLVIKMRIICGHPKGIVSRPTQMEKLFAFFEEESEEVKEQVKNDAMKLKNVSGQEHIESSSKLIFIDKLLCQLHYENCKYVKNYSTNFEKHKKEVAAYTYHKMQEQNNTQKKKREHSGKFKKIEALENSPLFMEIYNKGKFDLKPTSEKEDLLKNFMHTVPIDNECPYKKKRCIYDSVKELFKNSNNPNNKNIFFKDDNNENDLLDDHYIGNNTNNNMDNNEENKKDSDNDMDSSKENEENNLFDDEEEDNSDYKKNNRTSYDANSDEEYGKNYESSSNKKKKKKKLILEKNNNNNNSKNYKKNKKRNCNSSSDSNDDNEEEEEEEEDTSDENGEGELDEEEYQVKEGNSNSKKKKNNQKKNEDKKLKGKKIKNNKKDDKIVSLSENCKMMNIKEFFKSEKEAPNNMRDKNDTLKKMDKSNVKKEEIDETKTGGELKKEQENEKVESCYENKSKTTDEIDEKKIDPNEYKNRNNENNSKEEEVKKREREREKNCEEETIKCDNEEKETISADKKDSHEEKDENSEKMKKGEIKMHKVLIFTQFQLVLDELEEYCKYRCWKYMRLDGSTNKLIRELDIREFNLSNSIYFIYLISTRAGGLGINLTAANHVIMYDEDWNPFIDLQAIDRAHRIGQRREVNVWKLMTEWTVEERMAFRREQKLKLDKLVVQTQDDEDLLDNFEEKLSSDEIRKLMLHGKAAIQNMNVENTSDLSLEFFIERGRRKLPIINGIDLEKEEKCTIEKEINSINEDDIYVEKDEINDAQNIEDDNAIDIDEVMIDEAEEPEIRHNNTNLTDCSPSYAEGNDQLYLNNLNKSKTALSKANTSTNQFSSNNMSTDTTLWRSVRERKKPQNMYTPEYWGRKQEVKQIKHEYRCFICNNTKNYKTTVKDRNGNDIEIDYGDMINCFRCPKTYHKLCEGIKDENVKKTWTCSWHECCLCFRKSSQCGNLLIHCATCPTSFCYNCFPPDYVRYYVGEEYYHNLRQRGVNFTPQNWVCFLCSKCKAVEEQKKRRKMTKEERENEKQLQKELRSQLQDSKQEELEAKKRKRAQQMERDKFIIENRKRIDALDQKYETQLRNAYENLFPVNFVKELINRIEHAKMLKQKGIDEDNKEVSKKKSTTFLHTKLPHKLLVLCENCKLPCHANYKYPGKCCFPLELDKSYFYANSSFNQSNKESIDKKATSKNEPSNEVKEKEEKNEQENNKAEEEINNIKEIKNVKEENDKVNEERDEKENTYKKSTCDLKIENKKSDEDITLNNSLTYKNSKVINTNGDENMYFKEIAIDIKIPNDLNNNENDFANKNVKCETEDKQDNSNNYEKGESKENEEENEEEDFNEKKQNKIENCDSEDKFKTNTNENVKNSTLTNNENEIKTENNDNNHVTTPNNNDNNSLSNSKGKTRRFLRAVCSKCGTVQLGKLAHFRKHCDKLTEEEKNEYEEKREKLKHLIELLNTKKIEDEYTEEEYKNMSIFKFKSLYNYFQDKADDILEECIREMKWDILISGKKKVVKKEKESKKNYSKNEENKNEDNINSNSKSKLTHLLYSQPLTISSDCSETKDIIEIKSDITDEMREIINEEISSYTGKRKKYSKNTKKVKKKKINDNNVESNISNSQNENELQNLNLIINPFHEQLIKDAHNVNFIRESFNDEFLNKAKEFLRVTKSKLLNNSFSESSDAEILGSSEYNQKLIQDDLEKSIIQDYLNKMKNSFTTDNNSQTDKNNFNDNSNKLNYTNSCTSIDKEDINDYKNELYKNSYENTNYCICSSKSNSCNKDHTVNASKSNEKIEEFNKNSNYSVNDFNADIYNIDKNMQSEEIEKKLLDLCSKTNLMKSNLQNDSTEKKSVIIEEDANNFLVKKNEKIFQKEKKASLDDNVDYDIKKITNSSEATGSNKVQEYILYRRKKTSNSANSSNMNDSNADNDNNNNANDDNLLSSNDNIFQHLNLDDVKNFLKNAEMNNNEKLPEIN